MANFITVLPGGGSKLVSSWNQLFEAKLLVVTEECGGVGRTAVATM